MDVLQEFILPLFDQIPVKGPPKINELIQTGLNEYSLYVNLEDVYNRTTQSHLIPVHHKRVEYQIPTWYHRIVLANKGHHFQDLIIQIKTLKHDSFLRVNSHDLLVHHSVPLTEWQQEEGTFSFNHLDDEEIKVPLSEKLIVIPEKGLPKPNGNRGDLYVLLTIRLGEKVEDLQDTLLDVLNYDSHSNVIV